MGAEGVGSIRMEGMSRHKCMGRGENESALEAGSRAWPVGGQSKVRGRVECRQGGRVTCGLCLPLEWSRSVRCFDRDLTRAARLLTLQGERLRPPAAVLPHRPEAALVAYPEAVAAAAVREVGSLRLPWIRRRQRLRWQRSWAWVFHRTQARSDDGAISSAFASCWHLAGRRS